MIETNEQDFILTLSLFIPSNIPEGLLKNGYNT